MVWVTLELTSGGRLKVRADKIESVEKNSVDGEYKLTMDSTDYHSVYAPDRAKGDAGLDALVRVIHQAWNQSKA